MNTQTTAKPHRWRSTRIGFVEPALAWTKEDETDAVEALTTYFRDAPDHPYLGALFTTALAGWVQSRISSDFLPDIFMAYQQEVSGREEDDEIARRRIGDLERKLEQAQQAATVAASTAEAATQRAEQAEDKARARAAETEAWRTAHGDLMRTLSHLAVDAFLNDRPLQPLEIRDVIKEARATLDPL